MPDSRVNASDDVIGALSERVADLSKRVNTLQAELEAAQKRLAAYEEFDATIQDAVQGALRAAYQMRERAETTANQILEQAREERRLLLKEVERLRDERDSLVEEVARARRGGIAAVPPQPAPSPLAEGASASELRALATEVLRSMFKEIVQDLARDVQAPAASAVPAAPSAPAPTPEPVRAAEPPPAPVPEPEPETPPVRVAAPVAESEPVSISEPVRAAEPPAPPPPAPEVEITPRPPLYSVTPAPREAPPTIEDTEIAPQREESSAPVAEIQVVLSPVSSFARLVELERRIQTLSFIRSLYVRDFRGGIATLAVGLRSSMTLDQFAEALATLGRPALRTVSASRNTLELRLEGDASIA